MRLIVSKGKVITEGQTASAKRNSFYRGTVTVCGNSLYGRRKCLWEGTHFTELQTLTVGRNSFYRGSYSLWGRNSLYRGSYCPWGLTLERELLSVGRNSCYRGTDYVCGNSLYRELLSVGTHFREGVAVCEKEFTL